MDAVSPQLQELSLAEETLEQPPQLDSLSPERDYDQDSTPEPIGELTEIELEPATPTKALQSQPEIESNFQGGEFESIPLGLAVPVTVQEVTRSSTDGLDTREVEESSSNTPSLVETTSTLSNSTEIPTPSDSVIPLPSQVPDDIAVEKLARKLSLDAKNSVANSKRRPSALSGVVSMTRQRDLPPKSKDEEVFQFTIARRRLYSIDLLTEKALARIGTDAHR